ncbi:mitochondrial coenzyme A diphosphatase NUDT8 [Antennarius striatus]|uniref:mitochondrial coenzyme A diphosphatase NUDT8 n=1 Tax=Antennarius striatus TaxID=241820 RepID=UPI0035B1400F
MFRGPQILTCSCPLRPLQTLREFHLAAFCENPSVGLQSGHTVRDRRSGAGHKSKRSSSSTETQLSPFGLDCDNQQLRKPSFQTVVPKTALSYRYHYLQVNDSVNRNLSVSGKCTVAETFDAKHTTEFVPRNCKINTPDSLPWRKLCKPSQHSHSWIYKSFLQSSPYYGKMFVRPLSLSVKHSGILNHILSSPEPCSVCLHRTRAIHQVAPADAWRSCLSLANENRCRQSLGPNLKLYESDEGSEALFQREGKNQAKWASVLVSLCSVEGEPAFLFTLRSSKLKGRHRGDVSFAGGKTDPSDSDVVATALREAKEELGVSVTTERVWGILRPLREKSGMMVAPVLANLGPLEKLTLAPNPGEVEEIFTLSLSHLCNPQNRGYTHFRIGSKYGYTTPVFRNGKHRVWGLTAVALDHTLKLILPH